MLTPTTLPRTFSTASVKGLVTTVAFSVSVTASAPAVLSWLNRATEATTISIRASAAEVKA